MQLSLLSIQQPQGDKLQTAHDCGSVYMWLLPLDGFSQSVGQVDTVSPQTSCR